MPAERDLARRIAARIELRDVRLSVSRFELTRIPSGDALTYSFDETLQVGWQADQPLFTLNCQYAVDVSEQVVTESDDSDALTESDSDVASISFTLSGLFQIALRDGDAPATEAEVTAYCSTTGSFALYPFAREYVADVTRRIGLPSLTLPVKIMPVSKDEQLDD